VNWQDELRKLDEELASGRVSADEYRTRRDQVLASAHAVPPIQQQWQANPPTAPAQQQGQQPPDSATQYLRPVAPDAGQGQPPNPDATQVVSGGRPAARPPQDVDRTQVVPGGGMQPQPQYGQPSPPHGFSAQQPPASPWGSGDTSAPWATTSGDSWLRQGPEVFDETSGGGGKKVLAIVGVVLVIALIGGAIWFFGIRESSPSAGGGTTTSAGTDSSAAPTTTTTEPPIDLIPAPPGTPNPANGVVPVAEAVEAKILTAEEATAVEAAGITEVSFKGGTAAAFTHDTTVFEAEDADKAEALAEALVQLQTKAGMVPGAKGVMPQSSTVHQLVRKGQPGFYRCVYVTGTKVVRIGTVQTPIGVDDKELIKKFQEFGGTVVKEFPIS
jgi:hypothetical protein